MKGRDRALIKWQVKGFVDSRDTAFVESRGPSLLTVEGI